jgi:hypothetical protein
MAQEIILLLVVAAGDLTVTSKENGNHFKVRLEDAQKPHDFLITNDNWVEIYATICCCKRRTTKTILFSKILTQIELPMAK